MNTLYPLLITHHPSRLAHFTLLILSFLIIDVFLIPSRSESQELSEFPVKISSQELTEQKGIYTLKGNINIIKTTDSETMQVQAEEGLYNATNAQAELKGNVYYEDNGISIKASRATLNLRDRTGVLYDAEIVFKKDYMRIISPEVQKISENHFVFKKATFTTCEGPVPDWCIKGRDVDFIKGDRITSKDATFNIKGIPVFYTPYIWAPALTERKTGFLIPSFSYSDRLGSELKTPFYIVLGENADSTVILDLYSERGIGKGLEFRYRGLPENYLDLWAYHIRDSKMENDFYELLIRQQYYQLESPHVVTRYPSFREFLSIHAVTEDFFETYNPLREVRLTRFLDSAAEMSYTGPSSRFFIHGQYWQDLDRDTSIVSQRLPEAGVFLYPSKLYDKLSYWFEARVGNFYREEGIKGQRLMLSPGVIHSAGERFVLSQSLNLRGIYYWLKDEGMNKGFQKERSLSEIDYSLKLSTMLYKRDGAFMHTVEPSIGFIRKEILSSDRTLEEPFDIRDIFKKTSEIDIDLLNRFHWPDTIFQIRLSQPYDALGPGRWLPFTGEASLRIKRFYAQLRAEYDIEEEMIKTLTFRTGLAMERLRFSIAERYSQDLNLLFLSTSIFYDISRVLSLNSTLWYDMKGEGLRNFISGISWKRQCWTLNLRYIKTPGDYSILASIDLKGL